jgi:hypothetical protein
MTLRRARRPALFTPAILLAAWAGGCGGPQEAGPALETRPLEEEKALEVIGDEIADRGLTIERDVAVSLSAAQTFQADVRVVDRRIVIEYLSSQDRVEIGAIPPPAPGSKLHVLPCTTTPAAAGQAREQLFVLFLDDRGFEYQFNPTSENRADVTLAEVRSRLRRDLVDFFTWYDATQKTP